MNDLFKSSVQFGNDPVDVGFYRHEFDGFRVGAVALRLRQCSPIDSVSTAKSHRGDTRMHEDGDLLSLTWRFSGSPGVLDDPPATAEQVPPAARFGMTRD
ncbi:MAG: hypothetical protein LAP21_25765 [Acidobacteriia bacterium]|nr:hypothetical protein [Terriglobia bacterium]